MNKLVYPLILSLLWLSVQATETVNLEAGDSKCYSLITGKNVNIQLDVLNIRPVWIYFMDGDEEFGERQAQFYNETYYVSDGHNFQFCTRNDYIPRYSIIYEITINFYDSADPADISITDDIITSIFIAGITLLLLCICCGCLYFTCRACIREPDNGPNFTSDKWNKEFKLNIQTSSPTVEMEELPKKSNKTKYIGTPEYV